MVIQIGKILQAINNVEDLRQLDVQELPPLCDEIRKYIIDVTSLNPGHLGASLGVVELTVAIHYVFNTPHDKLVWDVGHQAYAHKIITGRRESFMHLRKLDGISGFPKIMESEFDAFGTGHSSTSISATLGMAIASALKEKNGKEHIAVIGDGSMTGGMALEGLNNAGVSNANLLVILNDNGIAIDKNVGAIKQYLVDITTSKGYNRFKDFVWKMMGGNTNYGSNSRAIVKQISNALKSSFLKKSNLFETFNFRYFGPTDGHDVIHLVKLLSDLKRIQGPKILHIITKKGKGLSLAENEPTTYHAPGEFNNITGELIKNGDKNLAPKYQDVFGKTIVELARKNKTIVGITPAMPTGSSLNIMMKEIPERAFDVGIAEQHAVTFAAGLASQGMTPFCNIYSTFMQRAYDQVIHDVAIQKLPVIFCLDRGGLVGEDGATHHGAYDLSYFRCIPNMIVSAPMDEIELRQLMYTAQLYKDGPFSIRYPRGRGVHHYWKKEFSKLEIGKGRRLVAGKEIAILSLGHPGNFVTEALKELKEKEIYPGHFDIRFLKPIDEVLLHEVFQKYKFILTIEDASVIGGLGSAVLEFKNEHQYQNPVKRLGIPDDFIEQGSLKELYAQCGFDVNGIVSNVIKLLKPS